MLNNTGQEKTMKLLLLIIFLSAGIFSGAFANVHSLNKVKDIRIKQKDKNFRIVLSFEKPVEKEIKKPL